MSKMPTIIARFLALPDVKELNIFDKFAYLIKSLDGDSYYFYELLPKRGLVPEELGCKVYEAITENVTYKDILNWYEDWKVLG